MKNLLSRSPQFRWTLAAVLGLAICLRAPLVLAAATGTQPRNGPNANAVAASIPWSIPASVLIGMPVVSRQNQAIGVVRDLVIDTELGRAPYAIVVLAADFLGVEGRALAFPLNRLQPVGGNAPYALIARITRRSIAQAPGFDAERWPDFNSDPYRAAAARYFFGPADPFRDSPLVLATSVFDGEVMNNLDAVYQDDIGAIRDLGIDLAQARVRYMVVEYDPGWNNPDRLAIIPREDLAWEDNEAGGIAYQTSRYDLRNAPAVAKALWPQIALENTFQRNFEEYVQGR